jgi:hypothetical protein
MRPDSSKSVSFYDLGNDKRQMTNGKLTHRVAPQTWFGQMDLFRELELSLFVQFLVRQCRRSHAFVADSKKGKDFGDNENNPDKHKHQKLNWNFGLLQLHTVFSVVYPMVSFTPPIWLYCSFDSIVNA